MDNRKNLIKKWVDKRHIGLKVLIGENGAGKSRLMADIATAGRVERHLLLLCNTPYDRFPHRGKHVHKLLASSNRRLPEYALKSAIRLTKSNDSINLRKIPKVLDYCGYAPEVGFLVEGFSLDLLDVQDALMANVHSQREFDDINSVCTAFLNSPSPNEITWIDFYSHELDMAYSRVLPELIQYESFLRKSGILKEIKLYVRKKDVVLPLREASSGELSLIASMVFLATTTTPGTMILIDEPENSLHPKWQREYVDLLMGIVQYHEPTIVIATHSPLIISEINEEHLQYPVEIIRLGENKMEILKNSWGSVEKILIDDFETVTPENHYLSELVVGLLDYLGDNPHKLNNVLEKIEQYKSFATDEKQISALTAAVQLAKNVANGNVSNRDEKRE